MTEPPVEEVFCKGPRDQPHERFLSAAFRRVHAVATPTPALWAPLPWWGGVQLHPVEEFAPQPDESRCLRFHLQCDWCLPTGPTRYSTGLNVEHKAEPGFIVALFAVLDSLWFSCRHEIEVRELVRMCREIARDWPERRETVHDWWPACRGTVRDWPGMV
jgi:hypothetical protein